MNDLDIPTAVREMIDRTTEAARLRSADDLPRGHEPATEPVVPTDLAPGTDAEVRTDLVLVDLAAPPRRNRLALAAAALVAVAAVGGGLAVASSPGSGPIPERTGTAASPSAPAGGPDRGPSGEGGAAAAEVGARLRFEGDRLTLQIVGPGELVESVPASDAAPPPGAAVDLLTAARVVRVGPPTEAPGPDEWNGTVRLASGEEATLRLDGDDRIIEIHAGDAVIAFRALDPALSPEEVAALIDGLRLERAG